MASSGEVENGSTATGALIRQTTLNGLTQQQWQLVQTGDGYYVITNVRTGKVLDVPGFSTANGTGITWAAVVSSGLCAQ